MRLGKVKADAGALEAELLDTIKASFEELGERLHRDFREGFPIGIGKRHGGLHNRLPAKSHPAA